MIYNPTKEMKEYAFQEMVSLIQNMQRREISCFSSKITGQNRKFFLGRTFCDDLIMALKKQYTTQ